MATELVAFFGALAVLVALAALARQVARAIRQPTILGELLLGVVLGPTLLGWAWPAAHGLLFGGANLPLFDALAWVGLILFMLVAGAEMEWRPANGLAAIAMSTGGVALAGGLGVLLAIVRPAWFFPGGQASPLGVLVLATLMIVTALPVLARILADMNLLRSGTGGAALASATIDDVLGWTALGIAAATPGILPGGFAGNIALVAAALLAAVLLDRVLTPRLAKRMEHLDPAHLFVSVVAAALGAAALTHLAGLHAVIGALAVGAIVSRHPRLRKEVTERFRGVATVLLLPLFFILTVGQADLRLVGTLTGLVAAMTVLAVASVGKIGGTYLGARVAGLTHAQGVASGLLVNARGAVGLVVAKVGSDAGLLSATGFSLMVFAIVATTLLTAPLLGWYMRRVGHAAL